MIEAFLYDNQISISTAPVAPVVPRESVPLTTNGSPAPMISLESAIQEVKERIPGLDDSFVQLPANAYSYLSVGGAAGIR